MSQFADLDPLFRDYIANMEAMARTVAEALITNKENAFMYDFIIIGGGIVGVSTALQMKQRHPEADILLIEKEASLAQHQTGRDDTRRRLAASWFRGQCSQARSPRPLRALPCT